ncbi:uncharacterized protein LOC133730329 [Rosa rugosa]|uniref:uncharacterized protein LOC133730329 n=1 Tax=Rosa rugosa TaxID=74645 RepID=UPI002B40C284|nr:uncharacterized protein LOC133730329 [Rosa rugosa]
MFKALFWNSRGDGSENFKTAIADLVKFHSVDILAICEPRVQFKRVSSALNSLGFPDSRIVEARGFSGGIWLLWDKNRTQVDFVDDNSQSISVKISIPGKQPWLFTTVYASPTHVIRASLWNYLENLANAVNLPCMLMGDFNELVSGADKKCGSLSGRFGGLRDWINKNGMIDMGFQGSCYTWSNNRVKERLDRGFCCSAWRALFAEAFIRHLPKTRSDHCPILLQLASNNTINRNATPFRFQAMWLNHNTYADFVSNSWDSFEGKWNKEENGTRRSLVTCSTRKNTSLLELGENLFWRQKSRDKWLKDGDRNTKFFHLTTLIRRRRNKIEGLYDSQGVWSIDSIVMKRIAVDFFTNLFSIGCVEDISLITLPEVKQSLFSIGGLKAPGHDGFPALFFQHHWQLCANDIFQVVQAAFLTCTIPPGLNHTIIALIPKIEGPQHMSTVEFGSWKPVRASQSGPLVSHLFFVDDLMLFAEASSYQARVLKKCLDAFCSLSGQAVSYEKSLIFCSPNTCRSVASSITAFVALLLPVTLTARLPVSLCDKLDKLNRDFTWGDTDDKKKVHLVSWDAICQPKQLGGLGIKKTYEMNKAMLAKASWKIWQADSGLWAAIYKEKYLKNGCLTDNDYKPPLDYSSTWRSISHGADLLRKGLKWRVGDGRTIKFWYDFWLIPTALITHALPNAVINHNATICEFWDDFGWNIEMLSSVLPIHLVDLAINTPTGFEGCGDDIKIWATTSNGCFTVKELGVVSPITALVLFAILPMRLFFTSSEIVPELDTFGLIFLRPPPFLIPFPLTGMVGSLLNCIIFDLTFTLPINPGKVILDSAAEWKMAAFKTNVSSNCDCSLFSWTRPPEGFYKLNVDGTRIASSGMIGAGGVIRDHIGNWIIGFQINLGIGAILDAEAWGLYYGLKIARNLLISNLEIESDSAILINPLQRSDLSLHPLGSLIDGCHRFLSTLDNSRISHIFRECNMTADALATMSIEHAPGLITFEDPPVHVVHAFLDDLDGVSRLRKTGNTVVP